jgi:pimeloyl-ACP methyl ester carboxylesterase
LASALRSFPSFVDLAAALSSSFSVYTYDRRGRGDSRGDSGDTQPYAVERVIEDLEALIAEAGGAASVHGLSSGAVLGLTAAVHGAAITKLTLFEPPLPTGEPDPTAAIERRELLEAGRQSEVAERYLTGSARFPPRRSPPCAARPSGCASKLSRTPSRMTGHHERPEPLDERAQAVDLPVLVIDSDASPEHLRTAAR